MFSEPRRQPRVRASWTRHELDAATFAKWGVDYLKVDGCGPADYYAHGYRAMGAALEGSGRDVVYSCSWPAYLAANESDKPFGEFVMDGCNLWRNWDDIQCTWESLSSIIVRTPQCKHCFVNFSRKF